MFGHNDERVDFFTRLLFYGAKLDKAKHDF